MEKESGDALSLVSEEVLRQTIGELLQIQAERNRLRLERERRDATQLQRLIATAAVIAVLLHLWF